MLKNIMVTGILLITISVLNAKGIEAFNTSISTPLSGSNYEELVNRLAADNDFKNYYISNVKFANKIIETNSGSLFLRYVQKKISPAECTILFRNLDVKSKKEFDGIAVNLGTQARAFFNKFPELKQGAEKEQKALLVNAFKKISTDDLVKPKFANARNITPEQCFLEWIACNTLCFIGCSYAETNQCYWECSGFCGGLYGVCWLIAE